MIEPGRDVRVAVSGRLSLRGFAGLGSCREYQISEESSSPARAGSTVFGRSDRLISGYEYLELNCFVLNCQWMEHYFQKDCLPGF